MLTPIEVVRAFDALQDRVLHVQVLKHKLATDGYAPDVVATSIETAIGNGLLLLRSDGLIERAPPVCVVRIRLTSAGRTYEARGLADATWQVTEDNDRLLTAVGSAHPTPMQIIKFGQSNSVEQITADVSAWARSTFGEDVTVVVL